MFINDCMIYFIYGYTLAFSGLFWDGRDVFACIPNELINLIALLIYI